HGTSPEDRVRARKGPSHGRGRRANWLSSARHLKEQTTGSHAHQGSAPSEAGVIRIAPAPGAQIRARLVTVVHPARLKPATVATSSVPGKIAYPAHHGGKTIWHQTRATSPP